MDRSPADARRSPNRPRTRDSTFASGSSRAVGPETAVRGQGGGSSDSSASLPLLLPASQQNQTESEGSASRQHEPTTPGKLSHKRHQISQACEPCRTRKIKCNGERPTCQPCSKKGIQCVYQHHSKDDLKRKLDDLEHSSSHAFDVFRAIQSRPKSEATAIFQLIRAGAEPETVLRQLDAANSLLQVQLAPQTKQRYDFPLKSQLPAHIQSSNNPYLHSLLYEQAYVARNAATASSPSGEGVGIQYLKPYHTARVVDHRLDEIRPSQWTNVSSDDLLMRTLLRLYFLHEYGWFTFFQKDHFLDDMVAGTGVLCSPLLVNAILAIGCHCHPSLPHRAEYWNPHSLGYAFLAEARRLWEIEVASCRSLTTLQATLVINAVVNVSGMGKVGFLYLSQAASLVRDLGLFESSIFIADRRMRASRDLTAWAFFYWQSTVAFHCGTLPWFSEPPVAPLPSPEHRAEWYGELWIQYPLSEVLVPFRCGATFRAKCQFAVILNRVTLEICGGRNSELVDHGARRSMELIKELRAWSGALPEQLSPRNVVLPSQLKVHLHFFDVLLLLQDRLLSDNALDAAIHPNGRMELQAAVWDGKVQFETIMRLYYLRHGFDSSDMMLSHFLVLLAFMSMRRLKERSSVGGDSPAAASSGGQGDRSSPAMAISMGYSGVGWGKEELIDPTDARSALLIAQQGLSDQGQSYYFPQTLFHVIGDLLALEDRRLVQEHVGVGEEDTKARQTRAAHIQSSYRVHPGRKEDKSAGKGKSKEMGCVPPLDVLMRRYADMSLDKHENF